MTAVHTLLSPLFFFLLGYQILLYMLSECRAISQQMANIQRSNCLLNKYQVQFHCYYMEIEFWVKSKGIESNF